MPVIKRKRAALRAVTFQKAHHFPPYHIWIGRETARLRARFIFLLCAVCPPFLLSPGCTQPGDLLSGLPERRGKSAVINNAGGYNRGAWLR